MCKVGSSCWKCSGVCVASRIAAELWTLAEKNRSAPSGQGLMCIQLSTAMGHLTELQCSKWVGLILAQQNCWKSLMSLSVFSLPADQLFAVLQLLVTNHEPFSGSRLISISQEIFSLSVTDYRLVLPYLASWQGFSGILYTFLRLICESVTASSIVIPTA